VNTKRHQLKTLNYFGGKARMLDWIIPLFPQHKHYVEPFCGGASVFLNKKPSKIETISDIDGRLINFFKVLREKPEELVNLLSLTTYSRNEFQEALERSKDPVEDARRYFIRSQQSFGGQSASSRRINSWRINMSETRRGMSMDVSKWLSKIDGLMECVCRLKMAQIENRPWDYIIPKLDLPDTFFFCDPPYLHGTRTGDNDYEHEMTEDDHKKLADTLNNISSKAMICGYDSPQYNEWFKGWRKRTKKSMQSNLGNRPVKEIVWLNYNPPGSHHELF